jgi:thaumarchaeosortase
MPIVLLFLVAPESFAWFWPGMGNLGRGGFLFVLFFLAFELMDYRKTASPHLSRNRKLAIAAVFLVGLAYFGAIALFKPLTDWIYWVGRIMGAKGDEINPNSVSWLMATDYMALTLYMVGLAVAFFGRRAVPKIITAIVICAGMVIFFLLDALFPYRELWWLQVWAEFIVAAVIFLASVSGQPIFGYGNNITILGKYGTWRLQVFWPSVGVESMLIFSLVMIVFAVKLSAPAKRKMIYAVVGAVGTVFLNVVRIFVISYYGVCCATSSEGLDAFHNMIGQLLYPVWIIAYLYIVLEIEKRLRGNATNPLLTGQTKRCDWCPNA